jgi:hypothetical protein
MLSLQEPRLGLTIRQDTFTLEFAEEHLDPDVQSTEALDDPENMSEAFFKYIACTRNWTVW